MRMPARKAAALMAAGMTLAAGAALAGAAAAGVRPRHAEPAEPAVANPAAAADAEQHARQEIAGVKAAVARRARHLVRWLAVPAGALAGWLLVRRRRTGG